MIIRLAIPVLLLLASESSAQHVQDLERIDPGIEDVGVERDGRLFLETDLRLPSSFDTIYRTPESWGVGDQFFRRDGAVTAVFPRSVYDGALTPGVPAGTIFHIGSFRPAMPYWRAPSHVAYNAVDPSQPPRVITTPERTIWGDEGERQASLDRLFARVH
ncbi:MAG: hypothetical protein KDA28_11655 [Phycisphaerales bacterium]|nr:hypothetical protein [Phycisphaerales bacterium]